MNQATVPGQPGLGSAHIGKIATRWRTGSGMKVR